MKKENSFNSLKWNASLKKKKFLKMFHQSAQSAQAKFELYDIYTNHLELLSTPLSLKTYLRYRVEIIHM